MVTPLIRTSGDALGRGDKNHGLRDFMRFNDGWFTVAVSVLLARTNHMCCSFSTSRFANRVPVFQGSKGVHGAKVSKYQGLLLDCLPAKCKPFTAHVSNCTYTCCALFLLCAETVKFFLPVPHHCNQQAAWRSGGI